jgi:hypothetical protein
VQAWLVISRLIPVVVCVPTAAGVAGNDHLAAMLSNNNVAFIIRRCRPLIVVDVSLP